MDNNLIIVLSLVVLAFLCLLIVVFIAALFMRITGRGIIPLLMSLREQFSESDPEDEQRFHPKPHADLRSIAQKHDFNAALAQQVIEKRLEPPPPPPITAQNAPYVPGSAPEPDNSPLHTPPPTFVVPPTTPPAQTTPGLEPRAPDPRFGHRRRPDERRKRDEEDESYGGLLDAAGDDDLL